MTIEWGGRVTKRARRQVEWTTCYRCPIGGTELLPASHSAAMSLTARQLLRRIAPTVLVASFAACNRQPPASLRPTADLSVGLRQARWGANVQATFEGGKLIYASDGIPNHARTAQYAIPGAGGFRAENDPTRAQNYRFSIPTSPVKAGTPTPTNLGVIGVMISGASLFNPYEGDGRTIAMQSNIAVTGSDGKPVWFLDSCAGHPQPMRGTYHYHALPKCVTAVVDAPNGPSHIIGVAFDGFPIYGDRDINGVRVEPVALDRCNGITSATPEFPNGVYHYVLLDVTTENSSIRCFSGVVDASLMRRAGPGMGGAGGRGGPGGGPPESHH
jgi:YHYH protein